MKLSMPKLNTLQLVRILLLCIVILTLAYEVFFLYGTYQGLNAQSAAAMRRTQVVRIDLNALDKAASRYKAANQYVAPAENIPNPFFTPPAQTPTTKTH